MNTCPCCSNALLRQIKHGSLLWFCRSCWSEMPNLEEEIHAATCEADQPEAARSPLNSILI